jgi:hypothetical protein
MPEIPEVREEAVLVWRMMQGMKKAPAEAGALDNPGENRD